MNIVVCIKQVPDPQAPEGTFYVDTNDNTPKWTPPAENVISTFDLHALEAAAQLKEQSGNAKITALCIGRADVEPLLRRALAAGADDAVRVDIDVDPGGDRLRVARILAAAVTRLGGADLVLCGRIAADWDMGHVPMMLAEMLGYGSATPVVSLEARDGGLVVERLTDDGRDVIQLESPCLVAVSNELNEPRYPTLRHVLEAQRKPIVTWNAADLGVDAAAAAAVELRTLVRRDLSRDCEIVAGTSVEESGSLLGDLLRAKSLV